MDLDPATLSTLLGIDRPKGEVVVYPLERFDKAMILEVFCHQEPHWFRKLQENECLLEVRLFNLIFTFNLFSTTHNNDMLNNMVHVVYSLHTKKEVDIVVIMCYVKCLPPASIWRDKYTPT